MTRERCVDSSGPGIAKIWRLALIGGEPHQVFLVREALRALGYPFELTHYADAEQAKTAGIDVAKSPRVMLRDWARSPQGAPMLFSVSGPIPEGSAKRMSGK